MCVWSIYSQFNYRERACRHGNGQLSDLGVTLLVRTPLCPFPKPWSVLQDCTHTPRILLGVCVFVNPSCVTSSKGCSYTSCHAAHFYTAHTHTKCSKHLAAGCWFDCVTAAQRRQSGKTGSDVRTITANMKKLSLTTPKTETLRVITHTWQPIRKQ